jgi:CRISPR-associated endonuclease/helicase Cas3
MQAWAKLEFEEGKAIGWRSLVDHCLDVAFVFRLLIKNHLLRKRMAKLAGCSDLSPDQCEKLACCAALHDLGKANIGFQNKKQLDKRTTAGHLCEALSILDHDNKETAQRWIEAADLSYFLTWFEQEDDLVQMLWALFSHHGTPIHPTSEFPNHLWREKNGYDPIKEIFESVTQIKDHFGFSDNGDLLPANPPFIHAFLGLLTLADWIGSDTRFFPLYSLNNYGPISSEIRAESAALALQRIGLSMDTQSREGSMDIQTFKALFGFEPRPAQAAALDEPLPTRDSLKILEADTGSGKTEMALAWFLRLYQAGEVDGLYFALPTRAAATQMYERVVRFAERAFGTDAPQVILAVPGYFTSESQGIQGDENRYSETDFLDRHWAAEHPKRFLAGRLVVGTVDQILLSGLQVRHSHLRAAALLRHLLIVDEVHASDAYMTTILESVLKRHLAAGGHALLLSATLADEARQRFIRPGSFSEPASPEEAKSQPYPALWSANLGATPSPRKVSPHAEDKEIFHTLQPLMSEPEEIALLARKAAESGARVGILRNTVTEAVNTQLALERVCHTEQLFTCCNVAAPHHGRFTREDRALLDRELERNLLLDGPFVVSATQTIEQSLDIDFDLLITDICPIDILIQRMGRLHRHKRDRPRDYQIPSAHILLPENGFSRFLRTDGYGRGPSGLGSVYPDLSILEATRVVLQQRDKLRLPGESRTLIEEALHPGNLRRLCETAGEPWKTHWATMWGEQSAKYSLGNLNLVDWNIPLSETRFPQSERKVQTRLGEDQRRLVLPRTVQGPFGYQVLELNVPGWMAHGLSQQPEITVQEKDSSLRIMADSHIFNYDRLGLRQAET